jgi:hypothetical protein
MHCICRWRSAATLRLLRCYICTPGVACSGRNRAKSASELGAGSCWEGGRRPGDDKPGCRRPTRPPRRHFTFALQEDSVPGKRHLTAARDRNCSARSARQAHRWGLYRYASAPLLEPAAPRAAEMGAAGRTPRAAAATRRGATLVVLLLAVASAAPPPSSAPASSPPPGTPTSGPPRRSGPPVAPPSPPASDPPTDLGPAPRPGAPPAATPSRGPPPAPRGPPPPQQQGSCKQVCEELIRFRPGAPDGRDRRPVVTMAVGMSTVNIPICKALTCKASYLS